MRALVALAIVIGTVYIGTTTNVIQCDFVGGQTTDLQRANIAQDRTQHGWVFNDVPLRSQYCWSKSVTSYVIAGFS